MNKFKWSIALITLITAAVALASTGGGFNLSRYVIANGGQLSASGGYALNGSIGQHVVASSSGGGYQLVSGFWGGYADVAATPTNTPDPSTSTPTTDPSTSTPTTDPSTATPTADPSTATPTTDPSTATSTPDPSTPTNTPETGTELLVNGGFETDIELPLKQPDFWNVKLNSQDKRKCNTVTNPAIAFNGSCAYFFKGSATEVTRMNQNINLGLHTFGVGDTLTFSVHYKTNAVKPKLKYKVIIRYVDTSRQVGRIKGIINTVSTSYIPLSPMSYPLEDGQLSMIKVQFQNRALSGKIFIDDASLIHKDNSILRSR